MGDPGDEPLDSLKKGEPRAPRPGPQRAPDYELPEILRDSDPRVILNRLIDEDPFELSSRCARRVREEAVLLNTERLILNTMARIAIGAGSYSGAEPIGEWVEIAIEISIDDMLDEQRDEERRGLPVIDSPDASFYAQFGAIVGVDTPDSRLACAILNGMSDDHREAFHAVIIQGLTPEAWAEENEMQPQQVHDLLREVGLKVNAAMTKRRKARRRKRL